VQWRAAKRWRPWWQTALRRRGADAMAAGGRELGSAHALWRSGGGAALCGAATGRAPAGCGTKSVVRAPAGIAVAIGRQRGALRTADRWCAACAALSVAACACGRQAARGHELCMRQAVPRLRDTRVYQTRRGICSLLQCVVLHGRAQRGRLAQADELSALLFKALCSKRDARPRAPHRFASGRHERMRLRRPSSYVMKKAVSHRIMVIDAIGSVAGKASGDLHPSHARQTLVSHGVQSNDAALGAASRSAAP